MVDYTGATGTTGIDEQSQQLGMEQREGETSEQYRQRLEEEAIFGAEKPATFFNRHLDDEAGVNEDEPGTEDTDPSGMDESGRTITADAASQSGQQEQSQDRPLMTLNRFGREYQVKTYDEAHRLASMGLDYTMKMQELAQFRGVLTALNQHPDLMSELQARMAGKAPASMAGGATAKRDAASNTQQAQPDLLSPEELRQGDEETNEQFVARIARLTAQRTAERAHQTAQTEVASVREEIERQRENEQIITGYQRDPLFGMTGAVLRRMIEEGQISPSLAAKADRDPDVFQALYNQARVQAMQIAQAHAAQRGFQQAPQSNQPHQSHQMQTAQPASGQPGTNRVRIENRTPVVERGGAGRRVPQSGDRDAVRMRVLEDLGSEDFRKLRESIKNGDSSAWSRLGS